VGLYQSDQITLPRVHIRPLEEALDAHLQSEAGHTQGKVVLRIA